MLDAVTLIFFLLAFHGLYHFLLLAVGKARATVSWLERRHANRKGRHRG